MLRSADDNLKVAVNIDKHLLDPTFAHSPRAYADHIPQVVRQQPWTNVVAVVRAPTAQMAATAI